MTTLYLVGRGEDCKGLKAAYYKWACSLRVLYKHQHVNSLIPQLHVNITLPNIYMSTSPHSTYTCQHHLTQHHLVACVTWRREEIQ